MKSEFDGLTLLRETGIDSVPAPVLPGNGWAVYEYMEGQQVTMGSVSASDIDQAVRFLLRLKDLANNGGNRQVGPAAEACLSVQSVFSSIELRLDKLLSLSDDGALQATLRGFLRTEFQPRLFEVKTSVSDELAKQGKSPLSEIRVGHQTLSPSDFGFHNSLRRPDGTLVFLDFEYFGWDDPAKMICDFLLHPGMALSGPLRKRFLEGILQGFSQQPDLRDRVDLLYPLFALKWCMILLNEFVPERLEKRSGQETSIALEHLQAQQLSKASYMLGMASA